MSKLIGIITTEYDYDPKNWITEFVGTDLEEAIRKLDVIISNPERDLESVIYSVFVDGWDEPINKQEYVKEYRYDGSTEMTLSNETDMEKEIEEEMATLQKRYDELNKKIGEIKSSKNKKG